MIEKKLKKLKLLDPINNADISDKYKNWILNISNDNKDIFQQIFIDLKYYSETDMRRILQVLYNSIIKDKNFIDNTLVLVIESQNTKFNSSYYMTGFLVESNNIAKNFCNIEDITKNKYNPSNIILCDDFVGSGNTIKDYLNKNIQILKNKHIYLLCIHCMQNGIDNILSYAKKNRIDIKILSFLNKNKYFDEKDENIKVKYLNECTKLGIHNPLGYKESEALVVTYHNTPNNTLGAIWENTELNQAVFPRKNTPIPTCRQMHKEKKDRRKERYINGTKD